MKKNHQQLTFCPGFRVAALSAIVFFGGSSVFAAQETTNSKTGVAGRKFVLEEQRIEGKIRRPQLVLIKADQRPAFEPMSMQSFGKNFNVAESVNQNVIESSPYHKAFMFENREISNLVP